MSIANPTGAPRLDREEPELASEEDIPTPSNDDEEEVERNTEVHPRAVVSTTGTPTPEPERAEPPKPANPEPVQHEESDPEKGRVRDPGEGHSEHPRQ